MYEHHAEHTTVIEAPVERVFDWLDDQKRLSGHMEQRSWKMGWGKMRIDMDGASGRSVGSHIILSGRVLGIRLHLDEVVVHHERPRAKSWETVGEPRLLVIGRYRMGFELQPMGATARLRVHIAYQLPARGIPRVLGRLCGHGYASWCVRKMAADARQALMRETSEPGLQT